MSISEFFARMGKEFGQKPEAPVRFMIETSDGAELEIVYKGGWRDGKGTYVVMFEPYIKGQIISNPV